MRVLFDHCMPRPLASRLIGHEVRTTYRMGWSDKNNGELLRLASAQFDVLITTDRRMRTEQNLSTLPLPVIVLVAITNAVDDLQPLLPELLRLLGSGLQPRLYVIG